MRAHADHLAGLAILNILRSEQVSFKACKQILECYEVHH